MLIIMLFMITYSVLTKKKIFRLLLLPVFYFDIYAILALLSTVFSKYINFGDSGRGAV